MKFIKNKRTYTIFFLACRLILCVAHFTISFETKKKINSLIRLTQDDYQNLDLSLSSVTLNSNTSLVKNLSINLDNPVTGKAFPQPHDSFTLLSLYITHFFNKKASFYISLFSTAAFVLMLSRIILISITLFNIKTNNEHRRKMDNISSVITGLGLNVLAIGQGIFTLFFINQICKFEVDSPHLFNSGRSNNIFSHTGACELHTLVILSSILCWACSLPDSYTIIANISKKFRFTTFLSAFKFVLGFSAIYLTALSFYVSKYAAIGAELENQAVNVTKAVYPKYNLNEYLIETLTQALSQEHISKLTGVDSFPKTSKQSTAEKNANDLYLKIEYNNNIKGIAYTFASISLFSGLLSIGTSILGIALGYFRSKTLAVFNFCAAFLISLSHIFSLLSSDYTYTGSSFCCFHNKYLPNSYFLSFEQNAIFSWACALKFISLAFIAITCSALLLNLLDMASLFVLLFKSK